MKGRGLVEKMGWLVLLATAAINSTHSHAADDAPPPAGDVQTRKADAETVAAEAENRFDVMEFQVEGNSVLPAVTIEKAVYPFLGESKNIDDVEKARSTLEKSYHDAGYLTVLVDIPEQKVDSGIVRLSIIEGSIDRLHVSGSRYFSLGYIKSRVPSLAEGGVPNFPKMQKELAALNRNPDRHITPVLKAGRTPGTVEAGLKVEDELPLHASVSKLRDAIK
ncbi:MAG: POTRA domain-containing protein [Gammaproteobacteria bacterium]